MSRGFHKLRVAEAHRLALVALESTTGGQTSFRLFLAAYELDSELDCDELAAAKEQGCARCAWSSQPNTGYLARHPSTRWCHHASRNAAPDVPGGVHPTTVADDWWCSEWRGSPNAEGATDER